MHIHTLHTLLKQFSITVRDNCHQLNSNCIHINCKRMKPFQIGSIWIFRSHKTNLPCLSALRAWQLNTAFIFIIHSKCELAQTVRIESCRRLEGSNGWLGGKIVRNSNYPRKCSSFCECAKMRDFGHLPEWARCSNCWKLVASYLWKLNR